MSEHDQELRDGIAHMRMLAEAIRATTDSFRVARLATSLRETADELLALVQADNG